MTYAQLFALFHRGPVDARWIASADATEYLAVVLYLTTRRQLR